MKASFLPAPPRRNARWLQDGLQQPHRLLLLLDADQRQRCPCCTAAISHDTLVVLALVLSRLQTARRQEVGLLDPLRHRGRHRYDAEGMHDHHPYNAPTTVNRRGKAGQQTPIFDTSGVDAGTLCVARQHLHQHPQPASPPFACRGPA